MAQAWTEALNNYVQGDEWQHVVRTFVRSNCNAFKNVDSCDYDHKHHKMWQDFKEMAENVLGFALDSVGGSIEALEKSLDEIANSPAKGPRDEAVKALLTQLLSFESFEEFAAMMREEADEKEYTAFRHNNISRSDKQEVLISMGFPEVVVQLVLEDSDDSCSVDDLVMRLSAMMDAAGANDLHHPHPTKQTIQIPSSSPSKRSSTTSSSGDGKADAAIRWFASYIGESNAWSDLQAKFTAASQVADAYAQIFNSGQPLPDEIYMSWADGMCQLRADITTFCLDGYGADETQYETAGHSGEAEALVARYTELEAAYRRREEGNKPDTPGRLSESEQKRMDALASIAAMGTSDEQLLHSLITRFDQCQVDINGVHRKISLLVSPGGVPREAIEEVYLYLKEQVNSGADLESLAEEMHYRVYSLVESAKGSEVVNVLLDIHVLEDEQLMLRQHIDSLMGSPSAKQSGQQAGGDWKGHAFDDDMSAEEKTMDRSKDNSDSSLPLVDLASWIECVDDSGNKYLYNQSTQETKWINEDPGSKAYRDSKSSSSAGAGAESKLGGVDETVEEEAYLSSLKSQHLDSLAVLKARLLADKSKKLQSLEDRLMRRQQLRKRNAEKGIEDFDGVEGDRELEKEIYDTGSRLDHMAATIMSGYKKRCLYEMKAAKAAGRALDDGEKAEAYRLAADNLKQRYVRDQKSLLNTLEMERERQRSRLTKAMEKKRRGLSGQDALDDHDEQTQEQFLQLDRSFEIQESGALEAPQRNLLFSLSAILRDPAALHDKKHAAAANDDEDEEEEENYLSEAKSSGSGASSRWLDGLQNLAGTYEKAGEQLRKKLSEAQRLCFGGAVDGGDVGGKNAFAEVTAHMLGVISDAFCNQVSDTDLPIEGLARGDIDMTRIKAGILEEFEKSRDGYQEALQQARLISQQRLNQRKEGSDSKGTPGMPTRVEAMFEEVIDSFLDDPLEVPLRWSPDGASGTKQPSASSAASSSSVSSKLPPIDVRPRGRFSDNTGVQSGATDLREKDRIRDEFERTETDLLNQFAVQVDRRKKALEGRLQRKREAKASSMFDVGEDEGGPEEDLSALQRTFDDVVSMVKSLDKNQLKQVQVESLVGAIEKMMRGEVVSSLTLTLPGVLQTPLGGTRGLGVFPSSSDDDQSSLKEEVKRISAVYGEEKQKLDLMMKIQQTRQRQALQRKLLERKQAFCSEEQQQQQNILPVRKSDAPIPFGGSRVVSQPTFRGLGGLGPPSVGEAKTASTSPSSGDMASRGLSLANIMRK